jgi:hypothetical protein
VLLHIPDGLEMKAPEISKGSLPVLLPIYLEFTLSVKSYHIPKEIFIHALTRCIQGVLFEIQLNARQQSNTFF